MLTLPASASTLGSRALDLAQRPSRFAYATAGLLFLALAVRVVYVLHTASFAPVGPDARSYDFLASGLAQGHGWALGASAYRPPGYPFFLGAVYAIVGVPHGSWEAPRLIEALLATLTVGLIGLMALQVAGRRIALVALAIAALYVPLIVVGMSLMTEALFVPLSLAAVNCALRSRTAARPRRWIVLAGLLCGLTALTRGNGIAVGIALAIVVWTGTPKLSRRALVAPATLLAVMVLTISPWTIRNAITQHAFVPVTTELGTTLSGTYNDVAARHHFIWVIGGYKNYRSIKSNLKGVSEATRSNRLTVAVIHYLADHPTYLPQAVFWNTMRLLDLQGAFVWRRSARTDADVTAGFADLGVYSFWIVGLLALAGCASCLTARARRVPRSLWAVPLLVWASEVPITTGTPRFRAALDPFVILLAAIAVDALSGVLARAREPVRRVVQIRA